MKGKRLTLSLRCEFTSEELQEKGEELSAIVLRYEEVDEERKTVSQTYREQLSDLRSDRKRLSSLIRKKGEDRPVECIAKFHDPHVGEKTIVRLDTGEIVRIEPMTDEERQDNLFAEVDELEALYRLEVAQKDVQEAERKLDGLPEDGDREDGEDSNR